MLAGKGVADAAQRLAAAQRAAKSDGELDHYAVLGLPPERFAGRHPRRLPGAPADLSRLDRQRQQAVPGCTHCLISVSWHGTNSQ